MNESQYQFIKAVLDLNKALLLGLLFCIQTIFLIIGKIIYWTALGSMFIESRTIGGATISDVLFVPPSELLEFIMKKLAKLAIAISSTKI